MISHRKVILARWEHGRFVWWPALDCVDHLPKGQRKPDGTVHLHTGSDSETALKGALKLALIMLEDAVA